MQDQASELSRGEAAVWMRRAFLLAREAGDRGEVPVAALLIREGSLVAEASNDREGSHSAAAHAEIRVLESFGRRARSWRVPRGTTLIVTVEPCLMCTGALLWARVDCIYYSCSDPRGAGLLRLLPLIGEGVWDHRFQSVVGGILAPEGRQLLTGFFAGLRSRKA